MWCSVNGCYRQAKMSTEHAVAILLRNEHFYCQSHFDSFWAKGARKRCSNFRCNQEYAGDERANELRFLSKNEDTATCHLCWLRANFPSVPRTTKFEVQTNTQYYGFCESDVTSIVKKQKEEKLFPIVLDFLQPQLGKDVAKLILNMI